MNHPPDHSESALRVHLQDEAATERAGRLLAPGIAPGMRVYLSGELGSGKTTLVRALLRALGVRERVKSPSYALVELYVVSSLHLYHFDFYRFRDPREWADAGFDEYFDGSGVCLVEWPERAAGRLPQPDLEILLSLADTGRDAQFTAHSEAGARCLKSVSVLNSQEGSS
ncbi:MAG: tRNA (adenosine(37)-N6)-threonylcarbamoyltransferase complex ATPase subunit type 1 TsaE [Betaproteobacteria bacterium]|nr:tRNA (adenosine(37)-N6)-threonylcarbamoyltransferase complex ATPase subunit type 1 TsaE [Betaproteobacteria bacterium]